MTRLSTREKIVLCMGGIFLLVLFAFKGLLLPAMAEKERLKKKIMAGTEKLQQMVEMQTRYRRMGHSASREMYMEINRDKGFTLFSFLDQLARKSGVKENIVHMKPESRSQDQGAYTISMVKVKLESLYLKELMDFLYLIEAAGEGVHISGISLIKTGKETSLLDVVLDVWMLVGGNAA